MNNRGVAYIRKGDPDRAIADLNESIRLRPRAGTSFKNRGTAYSRKGDYDRAMQDLDEAIRLNPSDPATFVRRGQVWEAKGERMRAIEDYGKALALPGRTQQLRDEQAEAKQRLAALLTVSPQPGAGPGLGPAPAPASAPMGRRVALVIGNASYRSVAVLPNPAADAREVAAALRAAGFAEVAERRDLTVKEMQRELAILEDKATGADWAVVYYAGHGIEVDGRNYLIPVDAELRRASDVEDETVALDRVLARISAARKLQLVVLDACRDNPFAPRMAQAGGAATRSVGARGLGRIEPKQPNLIVAYAAQHGEVALDGTTNSPYAKALVKYLSEPGLELGRFFRKVRDDVMAETSGKQRPFEYGSLTSEDLYFRQGAR